MKLNKLWVFLCVLTIVVGLCNRSFVHAIGDGLEKVIPRQLFEEDFPPEMKGEILDNLFYPVRKKLTDHIRLLRQKKQRTLKELRLPQGHVGTYRSASLSSNGKMIAFQSRNHTIKLWDVEKRAEAVTLGCHDSYVTFVSFSACGKMVASGADKTIKLWDVEKRAEIATLRGHDDCVSSVFFSPNGKMLVSRSRDDHGNHTIKLWDVGKRTEIATLASYSGWAESVSFSPNGKIFAFESDNHTIKLWDVEQRAEIATLGHHDDYVTSISFSPNGKMLASGSVDHTIKLWDVEMRTEVATLLDHTDWVESVSFSPDGKVLASAQFDNCILWDIEKQTAIVALKEYRRCLMDSVSFSSNGSILVSKSHQNTIRLWNLYDNEDEEALEILNKSYSKLGINEKILLYVLHEIEEELQRQRPEKKCMIRLGDIGADLNKRFKVKVPAMLNLTETYHHLPVALKKVVKDYFGIIE